MKKSTRLFTYGTSALFAAALTLQAQTSGGAAGAGSAGSAGSAATPNPGASSQTMPSSSPQTSQFGTSSATAPQSSGSQFGSSSATASTSTQFGTAPANPTTPTGPSSGFSTSTPSTYGTQSFDANGSDSNSNQSNSTNTNASSSYNSSTSSATQAAGGGAGGYMTVNDGQVTTFVQQLDTMGPAVVTQLSTSLGDLACSQDTVQNLVDALHSGQSVTITSNVNGQPQSATFNPQGAHMSYGEAYLAIAMAAQELRDAGVSTCATPEQWNAVLMGGPLNVSSSSTTANSAAYANNTRQVQGIVTMRNQGQGWGQIAQSANIQLGQVVNSANMGQAGAPTGFSSGQMNHGRMDANTQPENNSTQEQQDMNATGQPQHKKHWWNRGSDKNSSSTHADTSSSQPDNSTSPQDNSSSQPGQ